MAKSSVIDLSVNLAGVKLPNPLILASGFLGTDPYLLARVARLPLGAVTTKSCGLLPRTGHENPTVLAWDHGLINAVGLLLRSRPQNLSLRRLRPRLNAGESRRHLS